jgi:spermidine/putrescine transport system ATP-binding protein
MHMLRPGFSGRSASGARPVNFSAPLRATSIEVRSVSKVFGAGQDAFRALDQVSLSIGEREFFTLLGPSGCGKTTLLRLIGGFELPDEGAIFLGSDDITKLPPFVRKINTVFQSYALFPHMTVAGNIAFGLEMLGRPQAEIRATVSEMLRLVRMDDLADRRISQISGGQQQRVALARALAPRPKVLLLDEPLSALDFKLRKEMQSELKRLQSEIGITFVFVTHDQEEALTMSDRVAVMSAGRILQVGTPRDIYQAPVDRFVADFIGVSNMLAGNLERVEGRTTAVRLACGAVVDTVLPVGHCGTGATTVMIRPEHASVVALGSADAPLSGRLEEIVYIGADTQLHLRLADGTLFIVRRQNRRLDRDAFAVGDRLGIALDSGTARALKP